MTIANADFLTIADSIAAQCQKIAAGLGASGSSGTAWEGADNVETLIDGLAIEVQKDLLIPSSDQKNLMIDYPNAYDKQRVLTAALNRHVGGINAFMTAYGERVAPEFKWALELQAVEALDAANTFPPVYTQLYELEIIGANSATLTLKDSIDTDSYYAAHMQTKKTTAAGGADAITINFTCTKWDDTTEAKAVAVDASDALGTEDEIGIAADRYKALALASIVCLIGSTGEKWDIQTELERVVAL